MITWLIIGGWIVTSRFSPIVEWLSLVIYSDDYVISLLNVTFMRMTILNNTQRDALTPSSLHPYLGAIFTLPDLSTVA